MGSSGAPKPGLFPETRWTLVLSVARDPAQRRRALEDLVKPRWKALYVLARKHGLGPAEAEDAVQGFLIRLLENDAFLRLEPARGRFRAYLKTAFRHYLSSQREEARAQKRGGDWQRSDLAELEVWVASNTPSPEVLFDKAWAVQTFAEALAALEQEFASAERLGPLELVRELFSFNAVAPYAELAPRYGMSIPQLKAFVHRTKLRFRQILRACVADTLSEAEDVDAELATLLELLAA